MKHILIVDDSVSVARALAACLPSYAVTVVHNGPDALEHATVTAWDLLITDYQMPIMDGVELVRRFRALIPGAKTMVISGYGETLQIGPETADLTLTKPVMPHALRQAVERLLDGS